MAQQVQGPVGGPEREYLHVGVAEVYFSVVQRKVVSPKDFTDLAQVGDRLRAFS